jgi:hypothetical protein
LIIFLKNNQFAGIPNRRDQTMSTDDADDIVIVPDSATVASAAATHTALTLAAVPVYAFTGVTRWVYQAASAVGAWFTTPEYDATKVEDAIDKLQSTLNFLDTKVGAMGGRVAKYATTAKQLYATKQVASAVHQLRLKKMYEREMAKMEALKFNIESNILHMESVGVMMETVSTIKETSHQFQVVSKHVDIARLEGSIEEMFEQRDTSRDIESILNEMHDTHEFDDDELLKELEATLADDGEDEGLVADDGGGVSSKGAMAAYEPTASTQPHRDRPTDGPNGGGAPIAVDALVFPDVPTAALPVASEPVDTSDYGESPVNGVSAAAI